MKYPTLFLSNLHSKEIYVPISLRGQDEIIVSRITIWDLGQIRTKYKGKKGSLPKRGGVLCNDLFFTSLPKAGSDSTV